MALSQNTQFGLATALFGVLSFVLAVLAELKKVTRPLLCLPSTETLRRRPLPAEINFCLLSIFTL